MGYYRNNLTNKFANLLPTVSSTRPTTPQEGDIWYDTFEGTRLLDCFTSTDGSLPSTDYTILLRDSTTDKADLSTGSGVTVNTNKCRMIAQDIDSSGGSGVASTADVVMFYEVQIDLSKGQLVISFDTDMGNVTTAVSNLFRYFELRFTADQQAARAGETSWTRLQWKYDGTINLDKMVNSTQVYDFVIAAGQIDSTVHTWKVVIESNTKTVRLYKDGVLLNTSNTNFLYPYTTGYIELLVANKNAGAALTNTQVDIDNLEIMYYT